MAYLILLAVGYAMFSLSRAVDQLKGSSASLGAHVSERTKGFEEARHAAKSFNRA